MPLLRKWQCSCNLLATVAGSFVFLFTSDFDDRIRAIHNLSSYVVENIFDMMHTFLLLKASGQLCTRQLTIFDLVDLKIFIHLTLKSGEEYMKFLKVYACKIASIAIVFTT